MIYANHAGTTWPKPEPVRAAVAEALVAEPPRLVTLLERAHTVIASFLGAAPERVLLTPGCTSALATVIQDLPWRDGDQVVTSALEHHALARPVAALAARGVEHAASPYRPGEPFDLEWLEERLRAGRVRLVAMTAASNVTGEVLPHRAAARLAREYGAAFLLDAAQVIGLRRLDVAELDADLVAFAGHKAALGPQGVGGVWMREGLEFAPVEGATCSIDGPVCDNAPGYCDVGSVPIAAVAGLAAGIQWIEARGVDAVGAHATELAERLRAELRGRAGCRVLGDGEAERIAAVSCVFDGADLGAVEAALARAGVIARAGTHCAPWAMRALGVDATLRFSFGAGSGDDDPAAVLAALDRVLA